MLRRRGFSRRTANHRPHVRSWLRIGPTWSRLPRGGREYEHVIGAVEVMTPSAPDGWRDRPPNGTSEQSAPHSGLRTSRMNELRATSHAAADALVTDEPEGYTWHMAHPKQRPWWLDPRRLDPASERALEEGRTMRRYMPLTGGFTVISPSCSLCSVLSS